MAALDLLQGPIVFDMSYRSTEEQKRFSVLFDQEIEHVLHIINTTATSSHGDESLTIGRIVQDITDKLTEESRCLKE